MIELLFNICRWLVGEGDVETMGGATTNHRPLTNEPLEAIGTETTTVEHVSVVATTIA